MRVNDGDYLCIYYNMYFRLLYCSRHVGSKHRYIINPFSILYNGNILKQCHKNPNSSQCKAIIHPNGKSIERLKYIFTGVNL